VVFGVVKRLLIGRARRSEQLGDTLLPKWLALPVFASDAISSVAYATEEIVLVLALGGVAYLTTAKWIGVAIALLLATVVASYRQTCHAYPGGGGAYIVSRTNLGESAALTAAAALLVDYVMTVAVSIVSGVVAITSAVPSLAHHAVALSVTFVVLLVLANLRGVKESGKLFAIPTYAFIGLTLLMFIVAGIRAAVSGLPDASTAGQQLTHTAHVGGIFTLILISRAFASGCTALTGVEAISNGVPSFRKPKARNAAATLTVMGAIAITLFVGITVLALELKARAQSSGNPSVISQLAAVVYGQHAVLFYLFQAATAAILVLAANTAFNGFPILSSILARDGYLPRQLHTRGDRLVFSNGIILLAGFAAALIIGFDASLDRLIQLYIIGVFTSFTLSQTGMIRHWSRELRKPGAARRKIRRAQAINASGAIATAIVLVIVFATKVEHGAWLAVVAMVVLFLMMKGIRRYYRRVADEIAPGDVPLTLPARVHAIVLVSRLHKPALLALAYARATRPDTLTALTVDLDTESTRELELQWAKHEVPVPLRIIDSPYREVTRPILLYVKGMRQENPRDVVTVFIPEYVVTHWWQYLLHNQSALRLKARLLFTPGVMVVNVPYHLGVVGQGWMTAPPTEQKPAVPVAPHP
jgi:amino acid transporter